MLRRWNTPAGCACMALVLGCAPPLWAQVHEHGVADLELVVQEAQMDLLLRVPLGDAYGYERPPRTPAEAAEVAALHARLSTVSDWLRWPAAAGCRLQSAEIEAPESEPATANADHEHHDHDHQHDHQASETEAHLDLQLSVQLRCAAPGALADVHVDLFTVLPALQRVRYQGVWDIQGQQGQGAGELRPGRVQVRFATP